MNPPTHEGFAHFVAAACPQLVSGCARALGSAVRILDARGEVILRAAGEPGEPAAAGSALRAPIERDRVRFGELEIETGSPHSRPLVEALAAHIAERFVSERDLDQITGRLGQAYDEINLLYRFARILDPDQGFDSNAAHLLSETAELLDPRLLILSEPGAAGFTWHSPLDAQRERSLRWITHAPENLAAVHGEFTRQARPASDGRERVAGTVLTPHGLIDFIIVPVRTRAEVTGFVGLFRAEAESLIETGEVRLLECLAKEISNAATTRRLHQELSGMLFNTVRGLVAAIDAKDEYTRGHSERVYHLSRLIAGRLNLDAEQNRVLSWAALLHDVGKIAIDSDILNKPGRLTDEEYAAIKTHPARGCRVLEPIPQLREILPGIRHHHERWDGRGYPDGLRGDEIPLHARILAIADTYDAIVSTRAYRRARTPGFALEEIGRGAGVQFDPAIVPVFLALAQEGALDELTPEADDGGAEAEREAA
jgi:HD-GYP domain-containing protein (c-di-GMP phosphodiesterase class II)